MQSKATKLDNIGEEEQELDLEEDNEKPRIQDLVDHNYYFKEVVITLCILFICIMYILSVVNNWDSVFSCSKGTTV